jgi:cysteine desulfurase family protein (TIGR01976 family)
MNTAEKTHAATLDVARVRAQFPSLAQQVNGYPAIFFDAPGGTQVPQGVIDAVREYFLRFNANSGGAFATSRRTDALIASTRAAMADFFHCDAGEVILGPSTTQLIFNFSRAFARVLSAGDEIIVTTLDHDANVAPWRALEEKGVVVRQVDIHEADCTLDMDDLRRKINGRTRLIAFGCAANAVGTLNDAREAARLAHNAGALAFIDAVHYAPHGLLDVRDLDCDFLACSPYKFFGPHSAALFGKREHLTRFRPYKVRPATNNPPDCWEVGTLCHEVLAGMEAAVDYIAAIGRDTEPAAASRREAIVAAYRLIHAYELGLSRRMLEGLRAIPGVQLFGIADPARIEERVPTFAMRIAGHTPLELATKLGERGIFSWDGNYYALNLTERLGVEASGGFLRVGLVHYNTAEEVDRFLAALREISAG